MFSQSAGWSLQDEVRRQVGELFQTDLSDVRVFESYAPFRLGAVAFATGSNLYFIPGQYQPGTRAGRELLCHELAHVVQQRQGRVSNPFGHGVAVISDPTLEAEAVRVGIEMARVLEQNPAPRRREYETSLYSGGTFSGVIQCRPIPLTRDQVLSSPEATRLSGSLVSVSATEMKIFDPLSVSWFTDDRNLQLCMVKFEHNVTHQVGYQMPNYRIYHFLERDWNDRDGLYRHEAARQGADDTEFYDPVGLRALYRRAFWDSNVPFAEDYYYEGPDRQGDCFLYDRASQSFTRHDLISDFEPGDLLYGTERERNKVRDQIQARVGDFYITADEIHRDIGMQVASQPDFSQLQPHMGGYEEFLRTYQPPGRVKPVDYHPFSAHDKRAWDYHNNAVEGIGSRDVRLRRSCKALILFMMERCGKKVHFITDDIATYAKFTLVEKHHIEKYGLHSNTKLKFYQNGKHIPYPWSTNYVPRRVA